MGKIKELYKINGRLFLSMYGMYFLPFFFFLGSVEFKNIFSINMLVTFNVLFSRGIPIALLILDLKMLLLSACLCV